MDSAEVLDGGRPLDIFALVAADVRNDASNALMSYDGQVPGRDVSRLSEPPRPGCRADVELQMPVAVVHVGALVVADPETASASAGISVLTSVVNIERSRSGETRARVFEQ